MLFRHVWLAHVALRPRPTLVTDEGDPLVLAKAIFDVRDRDALVAALARHPDLGRDAAGDYGWHEDVPEFRRTLGCFVSKGDRLVLETTSKDRVERGRELLESLAGAAVRFRLVEYEDPGRAMDRVASSPRRRTKEPDEIPAELVGLGARAPRPPRRTIRARSGAVRSRSWERLADLLEPEALRQAQQPEAWRR